MADMSAIETKAANITFSVIVCVNVTGKVQLAEGAVFTSRAGFIFVPAFFNAG